ncbi:nuclear transport factor 2 family protein [Halococcus sediminicola]|uniref:nuclear transport factor 2 family protein n=1 Tax=Halococcus sediminicola TaxID=1264579 RepID=UPI000679A802|nr:nuclear transport factor 2 family protein [Halococcus sediminicola]
MDDRDVKNRLRRIEDRFKIEQLRFAYCYAVDERDWEALVSLFTENATLDYGDLGTYEGHDGIHAFATEFIEPNLKATAHVVHNPVIDVNGDTATGHWYVTSPITHQDGSGGFRWGRYDEAYHCTDGEWYIDDLRFRFIYSLDYEEGWPDLETFPQR